MANVPQQNRYSARKLIVAESAIFVYTGKVRDGKTGRDLTKGRVKPEFRLVSEFTLIPGRTEDRDTAADGAQMAAGFAKDMADLAEANPQFAGMLFAAGGSGSRKAKRPSSGGKAKTKAKKPARLQASSSSAAAKRDKRSRDQGQDASPPKRSRALHT